MWNRMHMSRTAAKIQWCRGNKEDCRQRQYPHKRSVQEELVSPLKSGSHLHEESWGHLGLVLLFIFSTNLHSLIWVSVFVTSSFPFSWFWLTFCFCSFLSILSAFFFFVYESKATLFSSSFQIPKVTGNWNYKCKISSV